MSSSATWSPSSPGDLGGSTVLGLVAGVVLSATIQSSSVSAHSGATFARSPRWWLSRSPTCRWTRPAGAAIRGRSSRASWSATWSSSASPTHSSTSTTCRLRRDARGRRHRLRVPDDRREHPVPDARGHLLPGLAVIAVLILVARPITVAVRAAPDRRAAWSLPSSRSCPGRGRPASRPRRSSAFSRASRSARDILSSVVAIAIIVTLLAQALPAPWLAGRLGLLDGADEDKDVEAARAAALAGGDALHREQLALDHEDIDVAPSASATSTMTDPPNGSTIVMGVPGGQLATRRTSLTGAWNAPACPGAGAAPDRSARRRRRRKSLHISARLPAAAGADSLNAWMRQEHGGNRAARRPSSSARKLQVAVELHCVTCRGRP